MVEGCCLSKHALMAPEASEPFRPEAWTGDRPRGLRRLGTSSTFLWRPMRRQPPRWYRTAALPSRPAGLKESRTVLSLRTFLRCDDRGLRDPREILLGKSQVAGIHRGFAVPSGLYRPISWTASQPCHRSSMAGRIPRRRPRLNPVARLPGGPGEGASAAEGRMQSRGGIKADEW